MALLLLFEADDLFADGEGTKWIGAERIDTPHTHGTGCVLSAAIAAYLAGGTEIFEAVRMAKRFVTEARVSAQIASDHVVDVFASDVQPVPWLGP